MYELETIRVFLSLNLDEQSADNASNVQFLLKQKLSGMPVKWEDAKKLHLTLRFLGSVNIDEISGLSEVLERLKFDFEKISFNANSIGFFPNPKYPNVVYLGLEETGDNSEKLVGFIDRIICNFGVKPDKKFVPHITLGRFKRGKRVKLAEKIEIDFKVFCLEFGSFNLMQSHLTPSGSIYEVIKEIKFSN